MTVLNAAHCLRRRPRDLDWQRASAARTFSNDGSIIRARAPLLAATWALASWKAFTVAWIVPKAACRRYTAREQALTREGVMRKQTNLLDDGILAVLAADSKALDAREG